MKPTAAPTLAPQSGPSWRAPSAALADFTPPAAGWAAVGSALSREFARYGFRAAGLNLLIARGSDAKLLDASGIAPIPNGPAWLLGMKNLAGHPTPVFDLCAALSLPVGQAPSTPMVLVLGKGDDALGLLIEGHTVALRGLSAAQGGAQAVPARLAPYSPAAWLGQGELWFEFEHASLFSALRHAAH